MSRLMLGPGGEHNARAALQSALEEISPDTPTLVAWLDTGGQIRWRASGITNAEGAFIGTKLVRLAHGDDEAADIPHD